MAEKITITDKEYQEKLFEVAKTLLPSMVDKQTEAYLVDRKKRGSLVFNCVAISEHLLEELGYENIDSNVAPGLDQTAIRNINEILGDD